MRRSYICPRGRWAAACPSMLFLVPLLLLRAVAGQCPPGLYLDAGACVECPVGTYWDAGACVDCPVQAVCTSPGMAFPPLPPTYSSSTDTCVVGGCVNAVNLPDSSSCSLCLPGFAMISGGCQPCSPGQYSGHYGGTACVLCPNGTYSTSNASVGCVACSAGKYASSPGLTMCTTCGFRQTNTPLLDGCACVAGSSGVDGSCGPCSPGHYWAVGVCIPCPDGLGLSEVMADTCEPCPPGFFSRGNGICTLCPLSTFTGVKSSSSCTMCANGYVALKDRTKCVPAVDMCAGTGSFYDVGNETCRPCSSCAPGFFINTSCAPMADTQCGACATCPDEGSVIDRPCSQDADTRCRVCQPGSYANRSSVCTPCAHGFYTSEYGSGTCFRCLAHDLYPNLNKTACITSPEPGGYLKLEEGRLAYAPCPAGSYGPGDGGCYPCLGRWDPAIVGQSSCGGCAASLLTGLCTNELPTIQCF